MKYLCFDGSCGLAGDMIVASLLDLGANKIKLDEAFNSIKSKEFDYVIKRKNSYSISGLDFDVILHHHTIEKEENYISNDEKDSNFFKLMLKYFYKYRKTHIHHHHHRHLSDIESIIDSIKMSKKANELAKKIFKIVAEAESKAHGVEINEVHFHEVGAIDSIVDIISASILLDDLNINNVVVLNLSEGQGNVMTQHGKLPIPVPAVSNIAEKYNIPLIHTTNTGEMITPTGIAIISAINPIFSFSKKYKILKSGIGLGKRDFGRANFLKTMIIDDEFEDNNNVEKIKEKNDNELFIVESNIDDSSSEELGFAMEKFFEIGAKDVYFFPCYMKKNRPAYMLQVLTNEDKLNEIEEGFFKYTTTIGIRKYKIQRTCMERKFIKVKVFDSDVNVKVSTFKNIIKYMPEFEDIKQIVNKTGKDYSLIYSMAEIEAKKQFKNE